MGKNNKDMAIICQRREKMNSKDYLLEQEPTFLDRARDGRSYVCPFCHNGTGETGDGLSRRIDSKTGKPKYKCFKCPEGHSDYDLIDLIQGYFNLSSYSEAIQKGYEFYGIDFEKSYEMKQKVTNTPQNKPVDYSQFYEICIRDNDYSYLLSRGISENVQNLFGIGLCKEWRSPKALSEGKKTPYSERCIIPYSNTHYEARAIDSNIEKKYQKMKEGSDFPLYNSEALRGDSPVFVVEGAIDCMSLYEVGFNAIALGSTSNWRKLIEYIRNNGTEASLILMLDPDNSGMKAQETLKRELDTLGVPYKEAALPEGYDPNECLMKDREGFKMFCSSLQEQALEIQRESKLNEYNANDLLDYFRNIRDQEESYEAKTGFKSLDDMNKNLFGGLHEGLYIIGAISSLGKTTFCLQLADQIAEGGKDVIFFSLEQSKYELMSKSISRNTFLEATARGLEGKDYAQESQKILNSRYYKFMKETQKIVLDSAIQKYSEAAQNLYIYEGRYQGERLSVTHIKSIVSKHIERTGNKPVIIVDYLQILAPVDPRSTDKQNTDTAVFELKELSRDNGIPVIAISSFNRESYLEPVSMTSFKESGAVEYSSDILFGLQYSGMDYIEGEGKEARNKRIRTLNKENWSKKEKKEPIQVELKCLKNRNGNLFTVMFNLTNAFNLFKEIDFVPERDLSTGMSKEEFINRTRRI